MTRDEANRLLHGFAEWAEKDGSVRGLALVGSWARGTPRDDSDLDLMALTDQLDRWTTNDSWLRELVAELGFKTAILNLEIFGAARSWRGWLGQTIELDLTLADVSWAGTQPVDHGTRRVVDDGLVILLDKDGLLRSIQDVHRTAGC
jgi:uncharacterized protein